MIAILQLVFDKNTHCSHIIMEHDFPTAQQSPQPAAESKSTCLPTEIFCNFRTISCAQPTAESWPG